MNIPFVQIIKNNEEWQALFAFQIIHREPEEWLKMRWGFNAAALLEESLDRNKLFIESQSISESGFRERILPERMLALRGIQQPGVGLQMAIIARISAASEEEAHKAARHYAREVFSVFPTDFCLVAAESEADYLRLSGKDILAGNSSAAQVCRTKVFVPSGQGYRYLTGLWQASARSNEQIWRALSAMPCATLFNVLIQPSVLYDAERQSLLETKNAVSHPNQEAEVGFAYATWVEQYVRRRLAPWKKFFLLQIHVVTEGEPDENLTRSIGSALTRDTPDLPLPGYHVIMPESAMENQAWREKVRALEISPSHLRIDDLADLDEAFAVFRVPYYPEPGIPGANFIRRKEGIPPRPAEKAS